MLGLRRAHRRAVVGHQRARQAAQLDATRRGWVEEIKIKADRELGNDLDANVKTARGVAQRFGSPALLEMLNGPLGDDPEVFRLLLRIGQELSF